LAGKCTLNLVKEDGNFAPSDYGPGGMSTYDVTMPFTDGYYPNPWTSTQPKPRIPFSNCIKYQNAPANAVITSVTFTYKFKEPVLTADYQIQLGFLGPTNAYQLATIAGPGYPRGSGKTLDGNGSSGLVNGKRLSDIDLQLRSQVTNPAVNAACPSYYDRDECRTKNTRLTNFTATVWY
jgi:hypothetical protein